MAGDSVTAGRVDCTCLPQFIEASVTATPDACAVRSSDRQLTYRQLDEASNTLAALLFQRGVRPGSVVAVLMDRSPLLVAALLAVWKVGAAYLPLDAGSPSARLAFAVDDSQACFLLTDRKDFFLSPHSPSILCADAFASPLSGSKPFEPTATADSLAYILYTSGSTGKPKAVEVCHGGLANVIVAIAEQLELRRDEVLLAHSPLGFDVSNLEIYVPLISGGCVYLTENGGVGVGDRLIRDLRQSGASTMLGTPTLWRLLLQAGWQGQPDLRVISGGEALPLGLAKTLLGNCGRVWNQYGPTEASICCSSTEIQAATEKITIGRPIPNATIYVLDPELRRVAPGSTGEIYVGGAGVARGYRNRGDLTRASFLPDPFSSHPGARMYKTGDLARELPDGTLEFGGRIDTQVKIRGHRIELEEIEEQVQRYPGVDGAAVSVIGLENGGQRLVAWLVSKNTLSPASLREALKTSLPVHMVPSEFRQLPSLPVTVNGKVDRKELSLRASQPVESTEAIGTETELESRLRGIWQEALRINPVALTDSFFELGGDSLAAAYLVAQIKKHVGVEFTPNILIEYPDIKSLAARISQRAQSTERRTRVALRTRGSRPPLFVVPGLGSSALLFRSLARHLGEDQPVYVLTAPADVIAQGGGMLIERLASEHVAEIRSVFPSGPYRVCGHSLGGLIAFEMANQLAEAGEQVALLGLLDSDRNLACVDRPKGSHWTSSILNLHRCKAKLKALVETGPAEVLRRRIKHIRLKHRVKIAQQARTDGVSRSDVGPDELLVLAAREFRPIPYPGSAVLFRARDELRTNSSPDLGWSSLIRGALAIVQVPGRHLTIFDDPNVAHLAAAIQVKMSSAVELESVETGECPNLAHSVTKGLW